MQENPPPENATPFPPHAIYCISGLVYEVLKPGTGNERPGADDVVQVIYTALTDPQSRFASSGESETPQTLSVNQVMPGLAEALQLMTVGQKLRVWIPPHLASTQLQEAAQGTLIMDIELVGFTRMRDYPPVPNELRSPRKEE